MRLFDRLKSVGLVLLFAGITSLAVAQTNIAPIGLASHSGGGSTSFGYGPDNYNDLINIGGLSTPWGWVSSNGWIMIEWTSPKTFDEVILYPSDRPLTSAVLEYWNGASWVYIMNVTAGTNAVAKSLKFNSVTSNRVRLNTVTGSNPNHTEILVMEAIKSANNAAVLNIDSPSGGCEGTYNIVATIGNRGINQIDSVRIEWSFNGVQQPSAYHTSLLDTLNGTGPSEAQIVLGSQTFVGGMTDDIKVWTNMPNGVQDTFNLDDTASKSTTNLPVVNTFPYYQDFEGGQGDWVSSGIASSWAFGTPAKSYITGAASGVNAFVTGGLSTASYNINENSNVKSPCFDLRNFEGTPWVALNVNWYSEASWDGTVLQSSADGGKTWQNVGKVGDPNNWYNDASLDGRPGGSNDGWAGTGTSSSSGWKRAKHVLDQNLVGGLVLFRLAFGSDGSVQYDGFAFDNFTIVDFKEANLGPDKLSMCNKPTFTLDPHINFSGTIGWSTGDSINETIIVTTPGIYSVTYTDTLIDESTSDQIEIVQSVPPNINFRPYPDTIYLDGTATIDPGLPFNLDYNWTPGNYNYPYLLVRPSDFGVGTHIIKLKVTDSLYCTDEDQVVVTIVNEVGIGENNQGAVRIYPNPATDILTIESSGMDEGSMIELLDINGKTVINQPLRATVQQRLTLDVSTLQTGTYLLRIISGEDVVVKKIVKE